MASLQELQALYAEKNIGPAAAAAMLQDNDVCGSDIALAQSCLFFDAVGERIAKGELHNITQHSLLELGPRPFLDPKLSSEYHGVSWFSGGVARKVINAGHADIMPCYYQDLPAILREEIQANIFVAVVSSMDKHGYFTVGTDNSITPALLAHAKKIFLEVNPNMPRSLSSPIIHISQVTGLWENDAPLITLPPVQIDETSAKIGGYIAEEIPNGATLQLGIGAIPDAVGMALKSKKNDAS